MPNWRYPEFDWDEGNIDHIIDRHGIYPDEIEAVFAIGAHVIRRGDRYVVMGQDGGGRYLYIICELRGRFVRAITARPMKNAERKIYERNR